MIRALVMAVSSVALGAASDDGALRRVMLEGHNRVRSAAGLPPLVWSAALAGRARAYAAELARTGRFEHAVQPTSPLREGENLWRGDRGLFRSDEMLGAWLAERRDFVRAPVPTGSRTGDWGDVAHITQILWRTTTEVGCATANDARFDYLVCRYAPAGNRVGQIAY